MNIKVIIGLIIVGLVLVYLTASGKLKPGVKLEGIGGKSELPVETAVPETGIKPVVNFSKTGDLVKDEAGNWILLYGELGNPAAAIKLIFNSQSVCDYEKGGRCDEKFFQVGERVRVDGEKKDDNLLVVGMTRITSE